MLRIVKKYVDKKPIILCSDFGMRQVFSIIIGNAFEAMKDGGTLTLETRVDRSKIYISIHNEGDYIPMEAMKNIFKPRYTTKAAQGGKGLGLFLANNIINDNGGNIRVLSNPLEGTTFTIILPL